MSGVGDLAARLVTPIPPRHVIGRAVADPVTGAVTVDIGGGEIVAGVPGSVRGVAEGQMLRVSVEGRTATVDAILTGTTVPTVDALPAADGTTSSGALGFGDAGYDNTGFTPEDFEVAFYAEYVASYTRGLADDLDDLRDLVNDLRALVGDLRTALIEQGHVA